MAKDKNDFGFSKPKEALKPEPSVESPKVEPVLTSEPKVSTPSKPKKEPKPPEKVQPKQTVPGKFRKFQ